MLAGRLNRRPRMSQLPRSPGLNWLLYMSSGAGMTRQSTCTNRQGVKVPAAVSGSAVLEPY